MPISQDHLRFVVTSPLGNDKFVLLHFSGTEELSHPFEYTVILLSEDPAVDPKDLLGKSMQIQSALPEEKGTRYYNGIVSYFGCLGTRGRYAQYTATIRPWLWFLSRDADCRIFQSKSVSDIIKLVFQDHGYSAYVKDSLSATYPTLDYCVQYRESALNFVNRLMERAGIYYFFKHEDGKHTLILADGINAHETFSGYDTVPFFPPEDNRRIVSDHFNKWLSGLQVETTKYKLRDYDFEKPNANLESQSTIGRQHSINASEIYDYPGGYTQTADGDTTVAVRIGEKQSQFDVVHGSGNVMGACCGSLFTLSQYPVDSQNRKYLTVSVNWQLDQSDFESKNDGEKTDFECHIRAIPSSEQYRPPRITPIALVRGVQTAVVVGPSGQEIYTDKYGRIKVQFHWDRLGVKDENSSCWIRVSQYWAGKNWGAIHIPRIGQEVIVDFLEGDPDRPIVVGSVYNLVQMPPYTLPDNMTQSGLKTRSTLNGTTDTFNELRFEDKKDSEEIYFHAEKDFNRVVENNDTEKIGYDKKDKGDQTIEIFNNQKLVVGGGEGDCSDGSQTVDIYKNRTVTIKTGNEKLEVQKGNRDVIVSKGNDTHTISEGNREVTISQGNDTLTISQGDQTITISAGKATIEAGTSIELKVGGSSIKIEPAKITLTSAEIDINANMKAAVAGSMVDVNASAQLTLKGGMTQIN